jgi:hypothetical protein
MSKNTVPRRSQRVQRPPDGFGGRGVTTVGGGTRRGWVGGGEYGAGGGGVNRWVGRVCGLRGGGPPGIVGGVTDGGRVDGRVGSSSGRGCR